jgi:hypothetical protein
MSKQDRRQRNIVWSVEPRNLAEKIILKKMKKTLDKQKERDYIIDIMKNKGETKMTETRSWKGISAKDRTEILKGELDDLAGSIITDPDKLRALAENWRAGFHSYSFYNLLGIYLQNPQAQLVAGAKTWKKKHNRDLKDGEYFKALWVLAPMFKTNTYFVTVKDENGNVVLNEDGSEKVEQKTWKKLTNFLSVPVYDINQTTGEELDIGMNSAKFNGHQMTMEEVMVAFPEFNIRMVESISDGTAKWDSKDITVARRKNKAQEVASTFHELAHHLLGHTDSGNRKGRFENKSQQEIKETVELEAEAVAYLVCTAVGIEHKEGSATYIGSWRGNREKIERSAYRVLKVAGDMIKQLAGEAS